MYSEVERELGHNGLVSQSTTVQDKDVRLDPDYKMKELIGYSYLVKDTSDRDKWLEKLGMNVKWAHDDFQERITSKVNPGEAYKLRGEWSEFIHDGQFAYTYSERMTGKIDQVVNLMANNKNSRQAVISIYNPDIDDLRRGGIKRVPCTMYYQFILRGDKLDVIYNIRSSDFYVHFPYDVWMACQLRDHIAARLGVKPGDFLYFAGSLHCFAKDNREIF